MKNSILGKARWLREVALATSKNNGARVAREWLKYAAMFVMLLTLGSGNAWGAKITYTFNSKSWGASPANWTSGKDGGQLTSGQGIQVSKTYTGANGTSPVSFTNISKIEVQYCTNNKSGVGTIKVQVGSGTEQSFSVSAPSSGGTTLKSTTFTYSTKETGSVKVTGTCTTNSVYIYSVTIYYETAITLDKNNGADDGSAKYNHEATTYNSFSEVTRDGYTCTGYWTASSEGTKILTETGALAAANITVSGTAYTSSSKWAYEGATLTLYAQWESAGTSVTLSKAATTNGSITLSPASSVTTTGAAGVVTVTATPDAGYYLSNLTASDPATGTATVAADFSTVTYSSGASGSSTITATFSPIWELGYGEWGGSWGDPVAMTVADGVASCSVSLSAMTKYGFKFHNAQTNTWYGNNGMIITDITNWQFGTSGIYDTNCRLFTGPAGSYTFSINTSNAKANLSYPSVSHPSAGYAYFKKQGSDTYIKVYTHHNDAACEVADWNNSVEVTKTISICNNDYFYFALTDAGGCSKAIIRYNNASSQKGDFTITSGAYSGKWGSVDDTNWHEFTSYTITFAGNGSDGGSMSPVTCISSGSSETLEANGFTKTDYTFTGWKADVAVTIGGSSVPAGTLIEDESTIQNITSDITLTAQWQIVADHYIDNIWEVVTADQTGEYTRPTIEDQDPDEQTDCKHLHYHFVGWITKAKYDAGTAIAAGDIQATGSVTANNATFYAVWAKKGSGGDVDDELNNANTINETTTTYKSWTVETSSTSSGAAYSGQSAGGNTSIQLRSNNSNSGIVTTTSGGKATKVVVTWNTNTADTRTISIYGKNSAYEAPTDLYDNSKQGTLLGDLNIDDATESVSELNITSDYEYIGIRSKSGALYLDDITITWSSVTYTDYIASCGAEYNITLDKNGGTTNGSAVVTANATTLSNLVAPTWAGHQVDYYMVASADNSTKIAEADGTLAANVTVSSTSWTDANGKWVKGGDATFYAKWKATECVITLNNEGADSGHEGTASVTATYGANTNLTTSINTPTKNGYDFGGYFTEAGGAGTQLINADGSWIASVTDYTNASKQWQLDATALELHAKWTLKSYTVTWVVNGKTEATQASVYYGTAYSALTEEPDVADNALSDCGSDKFVGWVTQEYTAEGGTAAAQYDPYKVSASKLIDDDHHTFYAMFAKEEGTAFTLDGEVGSTQEVHVYYTDGTNNYYATGNIGATSNGKIDSSTDVADANTYVFTKTGTGTYTIQKKNDANYIKYASSTDLGTQAAAYTWTISDVSSAGLGSWRLQSGTNGRAWICATTGTPKFGGYSTGNVTSNQNYRDVELGSSNLTNYRTGCCDEKITLAVSDATSGDGGTVTLKWNNADKSAGDQVSTCSAGTLVAKVTANPGYILTAIAISGTDKTITTTPADLTTGLPSTETMSYSVAVQALATGTLTITPTFSRTYTATYDLAGGETSGSTATVRYQSGATVTFVTPTPTMSGYNFTGWTVTKDGGGTVSNDGSSFTMPADNVTITATWAEKTLTSINLGSASVEVYVGQYVEIPVTYDPADILTKNYTLVSTPAYCVTTGSTITTLKITGGRGGVTITENKTETVSIKANADNTKTASVSVTVKPLPVDHYVDLIHGVSFDDKGSTIVNNELSATYTAPGYGDYSGSTTGDCETNHLHLVGWIDSEWADAHPKASHAEIIAAEGYHTAREAGMTASNKTYYAVWGDEQ